MPSCEKFARPDSVMFKDAEKKKEKIKATLRAYHASLNDPTHIITREEAWKILGLSSLEKLAGALHSAFGVGSLNLVLDGMHLPFDKRYGNQ